MTSNDSIESPVRAIPNAKNPAAIYLASLAPSGRKAMASQLRSVAKLLTGIDRIEGVAWEQVDRATVMAIVEQLRLQGKAPSTINHALSALKRVNKEAYYLGLLSVDAYQSVQDVDKQQGYRLFEEEFLSRTEVRAAIDKALSDKRLLGLRDAAAISLMSGAGLRKGEVIRAKTWDYRAGVIRIIGKGNKQADQPVSPPARRVLEDYLSMIPSGPLIPTWSRYDQPRSTHLSQSGIDRVVAKYLPGVSPHKLRHAYASWLASEGTSLDVIQRLMRHSNPSLTMRYIHNKAQQITASESLVF